MFNIISDIAMDTIISVENVSASYGEIKCLFDVNLKVDTGSICALLGPSGCGKTTLLSCILGRKRMDSGNIQVNGKLPGDRSNGLPGQLVGYMPQDISLYQEFTIRETFQFFGRLQKMETELVKTRQIEISEMLELPDANRRVQAMSGGQKRRLSFAVALLHSPRILILDEPTVGVDPLLR
jgi:ABC-type multidrug transport system ATPase subunit